MLTVTERSAKLTAEIRRYVKDGYTLRTRAETSAILFRPKQFNTAVLIASLFLVGVGVFVFIAYYLYFLGKSDSMIEVSVNQDGIVTRHVIDTRHGASTVLHRDAYVLTPVADVLRTDQQRHGADVRLTHYADGQQLAG